jgi:hypothetical protein
MKGKWRQGMCEGGWALTHEDEKKSKTLSARQLERGRKFELKWED